MNVTVTTNQSWFSRIASSFAGVIIGLILIPVCIGLLWWNEGESIAMEDSLKEGAKAVISVPSTAVSPANQGKLIHTTGTLVVADPLTDPEFGVTASGVRLVRNAEMYQWVESSRSEERTKLGGGTETVTTYSYAKEWKSEAVDSSSFRQQAGHENPPMSIQRNTVSAPSGTLGAFTVGENVLGSLHDEQPVALGSQEEAIRAAIGDRPAQISGNTINFGANPSAPAIGDTRVSYTVAPAGPISVVGAQQGNTFGSYQTKKKLLAPMVARGNETAEAMYKSAQDANQMWTWIKRIGGIVGLMIGFGMIMAPIGVLLDVLPFLGSIARLGTGIIGFVLAIVVGFVTIAIAWFAVRPILSVILLAIAGGTFVLFAIYGKKKDKARAAAEPAAAPAG